MGARMKRVFIYDPEHDRREGVLGLLGDFVRGLGMRVTITVAEELRTPLQNKRMWAMLTDVARQVKWPVDGELVWLIPEEWKDIFTAALRKHLRMARGIDGGIVLLGASTSKMSKRVHSELTDLIEAFGTERGVRWTPPEDWTDTFYHYEKPYDEHDIL